MANSDVILNYYDKLAADYDADRFSNTYGKYIHRQEVKLLTKLLSAAGEKIIDLGCGTGRLTSFATIGIDGSKEMLAIAQAKFNDKQFICATIDDIPLADNSIDTIYSLHVFMHLSNEAALAGFTEIARILKPGGKLIFDFPAAKRRKLLGSGTTGWHGNTAYTIATLKEMLGPAFKLQKSYGILFFPVHRLPKKIRKYFSGIDELLCHSFLKTYASYNLAVFTKK